MGHHMKPKGLTLSRIAQALLKEVVGEMSSLNDSELASGDRAFDSDSVVHSHVFVDVGRPAPNQGGSIGGLQMEISRWQWHSWII